MCFEQRDIQIPNKIEHRMMSVSTKLLSVVESIIFEYHNRKLTKNQYRKFWLTYHRPIIETYQSPQMHSFYHWFKYSNIILLCTHEMSSYSWYNKLLCWNSESLIITDPIFKQLHVAQGEPYVYARYRVVLRGYFWEWRFWSFWFFFRTFF